MISLHLICDENLALYRLETRGGIWTMHVSVAEYDHYGPYTSRLWEENDHGLGNAKLIRNLEECIQQEAPSSAVTPQSFRETCMR